MGDAKRIHMVFAGSLVKLHMILYEKALVGDKLNFVHRIFYNFSLNRGNCPSGTQAKPIAGSIGSLLSFLCTKHFKFFLFICMYVHTYVVRLGMGRSQAFWVFSER